MTKPVFPVRTNLTRSTETTIVAKAGAPALAERKPGDPHPYVIGAESVQRFLTVCRRVRQAGLARLN